MHNDTYVFKSAQPEPFVELSSVKQNFSFLFGTMDDFDAKAFCRKFHFLELSSFKKRTQPGLYLNHSNKV